MQLQAIQTATAPPPAVPISAIGDDAVRESVASRDRVVPPSGGAPSNADRWSPSAGFAIAYHDYLERQNRREGPPGECAERRSVCEIDRYRRHAREAADHGGRSVMEQPMSPLGMPALGRPEPGESASRSPSPSLAVGPGVSASAGERLRVSAFNATGNVVDVLI